MWGNEPAADSLTAAEIGLIRDSFDRVSVSLRFSQKFYARLFEIEPKLRALFPADLSAQVRKLMEMLATLVEKLDRPHELALTLEALGAQHRDYGVAQADFAPVGRALFETLETELGPNFDAATRAAWIALYALASAWMQQSIPRERCA